MNAEVLLKHFDRISEAPGAVPRVRQFVLDLAIRGRLVEQNSSDEPVRALLGKIRAEKTALGIRDHSHSENAEVPSLTRFPIPSHWTWARFGEVVISRDGERVPVSKDERQHRAKVYDYYGASGIIDKIDGFLFDKPLLLIGEDGANLINRSTPIAFIARGKYWVNNHAHVLDGISESLLRYLELYINAIDLRPYVTGTAQPKMNQAKMNSITVALPPEAEQKRIIAKVDELMALCDQLEEAQREREGRRKRLTAASVHHLNEAADAREAYRHARFYINNLPRLTIRPDQLRQLSQTILNLAVRGRLVPQDRNDEPAEVMLGPCRHLPLSAKLAPWRLPLNWAWSSLALIGDTLGGGTPSKVDSDLWNGPIPWVSPKDMKVDRINDAQDHISEEALTRSAARLIPVGSLLMVVRGMILSHSFPTALTVVPVTINQDMKAVVPFRADISEILLLITKGLKPEVLKLVQKSTHGTCKLLTEDLFSLPIPIPPMAEQRRIIAKVNELLSVCSQLETEIISSQTENTRLLDAVLHACLESMSFDSDTAAALLEQSIHVHQLPTATCH